MLVGLGFAIIAVFVYLILSKRLTPVLALILVPVGFGILAVGIGAAVIPDNPGSVSDASAIRSRGLPRRQRCCPFIPSWA